MKGNLKAHMYPRLLISMLLLVLLSVSPKVSYADVGALGDVVGSSMNGNELELIIDNGSEPNDDILVLEALKKDLLRVNYRPNGEPESKDTPILDPARSFDYTGATVDTSSNPMTITTDTMIVEITTTPVRVTIKKSDGTTLLWEPAEGGIFHDGVRFKHAINDNIYGIRSFNAFEGGGGLLRNNNQHGAHAGEQGDSGGPFMWSTDGYGVLVDSDGGYPYTEEATGKMEFYYGGTPTEGRRYSKRDVEYFVMVGNTSSIMKSFSDLTGDSPMMPKWSLGFSNFEWNTNQAEMTAMVDAYRAKDIPIDSYGLDYDWKNYGENNYGSFKWNTTNFPDSSTTSFKSQMDAKGIKMIGITKPRIVTKTMDGQQTVQGQDAEAGGYWYPGHNEYQDYFIPVQVRSIDPYKATARDWLWNNSKGAFDKGIVGWWNDETDKVSSGGVGYWFGNFTTTHLSQALYEGQRAYTNDLKRVWQTARTYYPGAQRYATTLWSGDIGAQFYKGEKINWAAGMEEQKSVMLSSVNNGQPKWGMDIGGFNQQDGQITNPTPELYARWMQFGAFSPVFRVHGNNFHQRQPWFYGATAEEVSKQAIQLRYSLLPYLYAYERKALETGMGLVRPLMQVYPHNENAENYTDGWMFGEYLYVSPVTQEDQHSKAIYLPPGEWVDYFTGIAYDGNQTITYALNAEEWTDIPLFIKKGAIIPSQKPQDYVGQQDINQVNVDIFPAESETSFTYYDDDGESYAYENGNYLKQVLKAMKGSAQDTTITIEAKEGAYTSNLDAFLLEVHGQAATSVSNGGVALTEYSSKNELENATGEGFATGKDEYGVVTYIKVNAQASVSKAITLSGQKTISQNTLKYEAELASLSGNTVSTQASVNNNHINFSGDGFVDKLDQSGAKVTFYPKAKVPGHYDINIRYANGTGEEQTISALVNGDYETQVQLPATSGWNDWGTITVTLPLAAGQNILSFANMEDSNDTGRINIDNIEVPFASSISSFEAESATLEGAATTNQNHWFYSGTAFVENMTQVGDSSTFNVYAPTAGNYDIDLRYANGTQAAKTVSLFINDQLSTQLSLADSGGNWNIWQTNQNTAYLNKGLNRVSYQYTSSDSGNINLDRIDVYPSTSPVLLESDNLLDNGSFERSGNLNNNWTEWHPEGQQIAYGINEGIGMNPPETAVHGDQRAYMHLANAYKQSIHQVVQVPENNTTYTVEAWVRLKNTTPNTARMEISNHGGESQYVNISKNEEWDYIRVENITVTNGQVDVGFYVDSPGGTTLHIDQVRLTKE